MKAFHAYDIRGIYGIDFTREDVYKIGYFLPKVLDAKKVLIGRDVRISSPEVFKSLTEGLIAAGVEVHDLGLSTTPMVYWATARYDYDASVMITASHNPGEYNGLKVSGKECIPVGYENGLAELEKLLYDKKWKLMKYPGGRMKSLDIKTEYLAFQKKYLGDISELSIAMDCSNGMAGLLVEELYGTKIKYINHTLDGNFPAHNPNPLEEKNQEQLKDLVIQSGADVGVIFDGDADRVMFIDELGHFVSPDLMIALMGHYFLRNSNEKHGVIQDIRTSKSVGEYLDAFGAEMITWRVGRAFAALKLREKKGLYGGELAGHYYFKDFYYSDSALMACSIILSVIASFKNQGRSFSEVMSLIQKYHNSGELNFKIENKKDAMDAVKNYFIKTELVKKLLDFDGYRLEFDDWWFNIRPSNTEPYLRLLVEAKGQKMLNQKLALIKSILKNYN